MGTSGNPTKRAAAKAATKPPLTFDHLRSAKKPVTRTVYVCLDSEVADVHKAAKDHVELLELSHRQQRAQSTRWTEEAQQVLADELAAVMGEARAALDAAEADLDEATVAIRLRSIGRRAFEDLWNAHPPTEEQDAEVQKAMKDEDAHAPYNAETFAPALIAACAVEPTMTEEEAAILFDEWNGPEVTALFQACMDVCNQSQIGLLGKGYGRTNGSKKN